MCRRIAVLGICLESNNFAPVTHLADFEQYEMLRGAQLVERMHSLGFCRPSGTTTDWKLVPILLAQSESGGPLEHTDYLTLILELEYALNSALPVDGVFIFGHGAGRTTELEDLDGDYFARVRRLVGPSVPIVAEIDMHANLSVAMVESVDIIVGYRTNPHVDEAARAQECAVHLSRLLDGKKPSVAWQRLPLVTAQISQLTTPGSPCHELFEDAEELMRMTDVANVTLLPGFAFSDSADNGFAVCVTTWGKPELALALCDRIARRVWMSRSDFLRKSLSIAEAVAHERRVSHDSAAHAPRVYADVADNPGGGGRGNVVYLLRAMHEAKGAGLVAGVFYDPALVDAAARAGPGNYFLAAFNSMASERSSGRWDCEARVENLSDGTFRNRHGMRAGQLVHLGRCCVLSLQGGGTRVVACSIRNQVLSTDYFESVGVDLRDAKAIIVKSRGHFRAGFSHVAHRDAIFEVDGPGLTTAAIQSVAWRRLPRPSYPIDRDVIWHSAPLEKLHKRASAYD